MAVKIVVVLVVLVILIAGVGIGAYFFLTMRPASVGPMPGEALAFPGDAGFLAGVDVKGLFASATYKQIAAGDVPLGDAVPKEQAESMRKEMKDGIAKGLKEAETKTGVRLDQDLDKVVIGVAGLTGKEPQVVALALGRFDHAKIKGAIEASQKTDGGTTSTKTAGKASILVLEKQGKAEGAVAFLDDKTLLVGTPSLVEAAALNYSNRVKALEANAGLLGLVKGLKSDAGYWFAAGQGLLDKVKQEAGQSAPPFAYPHTVTLAGGFEGAMELAGQMADEAAAKNAADLIRGGLAMVKMQAAQQAQGKDAAAVAGLIGGITVNTEGKTIRITSTAPAGGRGGLGALAAIAIPSLLKSRVSANESAAIGDIRTIISAQMAYSSTSNGAYGELRCLAEPDTCIPGYTGPYFVDAALASLADKSGYKRAFFPGSAFQGGVDNFAYTATPIQPGQTGVRSFCGDSSGIVCADPSGSPIQATGGRCPASCPPLQ
jgi:type II secretory pathway pseudopilin PulG